MFPSNMYWHAAAKRQMENIALRQNSDHGRERLLRSCGQGPPYPCHSASALALAASLALVPRFSGSKFIHSLWTGRVFDLGKSDTPWLQNVGCIEWQSIKQLSSC